MMREKANEAKQLCTLAYICHAVHLAASMKGLCLPSCHHAKVLLIIAVVAALVYTMTYLMEGYKFTHRKQTSSSKIGIFVVVDEVVAKRSNQHIVGLTCYALRHAYRLILINPQQYPMCMHMVQSIFFRKHCLVMMYFLDHAEIEWLLVLDMDILVVNMRKTIESYLPHATTKSLIHVILYERFNGEIAAGNYLIRNHPWSYAFLLRWLLYERQTIHFKFHNHDNGPLHLHLLGRMIGNVSQSDYDRCLRVFEKTNEHVWYHTYVGCCKCALKGRWEFEHVRILRRGHSFVRDNLGQNTSQRIWSPTDFFIHGQKQNVGAYYSKEIDLYECVRSNWSLPVRTDVAVSNITEVQELFRKFDREAAQLYPQSIALPDISDCWPYCVDTEVRWQAYAEKACSQNASWRSF